MRKRGKPNPEQKYFSLVVALHAETPEKSLPVCAHVSERIVVRVSIAVLIEPWTCFMSALSGLLHRLLILATLTAIVTTCGTNAPTLRTSSTM